MAQSLANKYRPADFDDMVGQKVVVDIVKTMCESEQLSNRNFLFTGPAGTGKTTLSRLIAKSLNGNTNNIVEVDAASHSGVDDVRELIQEASQFPIGSKYKVIICDEAHSFSATAWQAFLKCLEEQVGSTIWIFATTNPEKIPATIISRVQTFKLSKISTENIQKRLKFILDSEIAEGRSITYNEDALSYLSRLANGGLRDSITMLDKCLAFGSDVTTELLEKSLDLPNYDDYFNLLNYLVKKDNTGITETIDRVYNSGTNFVKWFEGFHSFLCNIVKYVMLKDISRTMIPYHYQDKLTKYNEQHAFICLKLANVVMTMNKELKFTQYLQETAMTYLCSPVAPKKEG
jgi:DNA polymerase-3 subunit gamma/tau